MAMQGDICFFAGDSKTCCCRGAKVVTSHFLQHLLILFSWAGVWIGLDLLFFKNRMGTFEKNSFATFKNKPCF